MTRSFWLATAAAVLTLTAPASAYTSTIPLRDWSNRATDDDLVVLDIKNVGSDNTTWFSSPPGVSQGCQIKMIDNTIALVRPTTFGDGSLVTIASLDFLHSLPGISGRQRYDMRIFFTTDFLWIELKAAGAEHFPTNNTVFFVGFDQSTYDSYFRYYQADVRFGKLKDLKADVQDNYSSQFTPAMLYRGRYGRMGLAALLSATQMTFVP